MPRKAVVHIGPMKTGSTSIQAWLSSMREELREAGFLVPASIGAPNMSRLSYIAQVLAAGEELIDADTERLSLLREEITTQPESVHTVIFSGEMLAHQLKDPKNLQAFKSYLDEFFEEYTIVLYLRRQDEFSLSRYSTALRHGFKRAAPLSPPLNYEKILNPWAEAFGRDAIKPRMFDRKVMPGGDVVRDFAQAISLPFVPEGTDSLSRNSSIRPEAQTFLADLAERVRQAGFSGVFMDVPGHDVIMRCLGQNFRGRGTKPARADAIAFFEKVRDSNERVRQEWFPDRPTLFSEDFSDYSEEGTPEPSAEQLLEVAMSVVTALITEMTGDKSAGGKGKPLTARRNILEKDEMRNRRKRHRKVRARRQKKAMKAESL